MKKFDVYQIVTIVLSIAVVASIGFLIFNSYKGEIGNAAISVDTENGKAAVLINGKDLGETPVYTERVFTGKVDVDINGENSSYSTIIKPAAGTAAIIKRDLGVNSSFSSGQNLWFTKTGGSDKVISVVSPDVSDVLVIVDGVEIGKTPIKFKTKELLKQNDDDKYNLMFKKDGYEDQLVDVKVMQGYDLNIRVDMFLRPIPSEVTSIEGVANGVHFINFSSVSDPAFADKQAWAKAINYWLKTRSVASFGNYKAEKFNYMIADNGKVYDEGGNEIKPEDINFEGEVFMAYLGSSQSPDLSDSAKESLAKAGTSGVGTSTGFSVKIKENSLGYLRIRVDASTAAEQVSKAETGATFKVLEEKNGWYKIPYEEGKEGWISGSEQYVEKVE
ncbi:hypothetical protein A2982_03385 [candidate division WWE3 bacterium RIFCSPLOWO2_01_FULL_39_13]|uniref:SH3b domain-containing protein n=1 Tax=candidate division WWE3 bacterium RIFCSPLOWO2_01_FULL_39_13 TaxID=1802624 RepID=A0A1F4V3E9_UNCKA|nr:MAG: hypothetical protein A2982_03385 [candidate division WWE3 bacterium RIFCSPLOWO2_01_FULL_39_13]